MAGKKKTERDPNTVFNPFYGKAADESHMAERPFFTWIFAVPGLALGLWLGLGTGELVMGLLCGAILGVAAGSMLDKWLEKRKK